MSIDRFCLVDEKKIYKWMICTEIVEDLQRKGCSSSGKHSVYVMQGGIEYLYIYMDAAHARADFENWRREPLEKITLSLDGIEQPGGRVPLTEEEIRKYFEAREQDEEWGFGAEEAQ
jgi:hypothetical protein